MNTANEDDEKRRGYKELQMTNKRLNLWVTIFHFFYHENRTSDLTVCPIYKAIQKVT